MSYKGFEFIYEKGQTEIKLQMPLELEGLFRASLYCRGELMDSAMGDPAAIWNSLSSNFNNIPLVAPLQVHGTVVIPASEEYALPSRPEADGVLVGLTSDCMASLRFADCAPVVIASACPEPWMMLLHSGFAGTSKNISGVSLSALREWDPESMGKKTWAWTGPCICRDCYSRRIDDHSTQKALGIFSPENYNQKDGMIHFDIVGEIKRQLVHCGIPYDNIYAIGDCTCCRRSSYYSYRAGDERARIFLLGGNTTKDPV